MLFKSRIWGSWVGAVLKARRGGRQPLTGPLAARTQRRRRSGNSVGVEALEVRLVPAVITVNTLADVDLHHDKLTLREALNVTGQVGFTGVLSNQFIAFAGLSAAEQAQFNFSASPLGTNDTIQFASSLTAAGPATLAMNTDSPAEFAITNNVTISGPGADRLTLDAGLKSRLFGIGSGVTANISGLTLKNGVAPTGAASKGGAIFNWLIR